MPNAPATFRMHPPKRDKKRWASRQTAYRHWYQLPLWRKIRSQVLARDCYLCQECMRNGDYTAVKETTKRGEEHLQGHADHKIPHNGNWDRFIDMDGIETLCRSCHSAKTRAEQNRNG